MRTEGALLVDVRTDLQHDEAHVPGSVCITALRAGFGTKLSWLADRDIDVVFIGRDDEDARHAVELAQSVGITRIGGFLSGGMTTWREEGRDVDRIGRITVDELHERWEAGVQILDVRHRSEWDEGHIPGSGFCPYYYLRDVPKGMNKEVPVAVVCASGQRAAVGASLLKRAGVRDVLHVVDGGVGTWRRRGWPVEADRAAAAPA
jgi:hydroxyacylglutathione hydrolase